jgi:hypothetical protein
MEDVMQRWEYTTVEYRYFESDTIKTGWGGLPYGYRINEGEWVQEERKEYRNLLNQLGSEGWELVSSVISSNGDLSFFLKRPA